jgi:hypothetical protein
MVAKGENVIEDTKFYKMMGCIDTKRREWFILLGDDNTRCQNKIGQFTYMFLKKDSNISFNLKGVCMRDCAMPICIYAEG